MTSNSELLPHENLGIEAHCNVTFEEFREAFSFPNSEIRAQLNTDQLEKEMAIGRASVTMTVQSCWNVEKLYAPWYRDPDTNEPRSYNEPGVRIWSYAELINPQRAADQEFDQNPQDLPAIPPAWLYNARVLTINVGGENELVLDGNHRLMARLRHYRAWQIGMLAYRICCPTSTRLVPDIDYWHSVSPGDKPA